MKLFKPLYGQFKGYIENKDAKKRREKECNSIIDQNLPIIKSKRVGRETKTMAANRLLQCRDYLTKAELDEVEGALKIKGVRDVIMETPQDRLSKAIKTFQDMGEDVDPRIIAALMNESVKYNKHNEKEQVDKDEDAEEDIDPAEVLKKLQKMRGNVPKNDDEIQGGSKKRRSRRRSNRRKSRRSNRRKSRRSNRRKSRRRSNRRVTRRRTRRVTRRKSRRSRK